MLENDEESFEEETEEWGNKHRDALARYIENKLRSLKEMEKQNVGEQEERRME